MRCQYEYGGHKCGAKAQVKVGLQIEGHPPSMWRSMCKSHAKDHRWLYEHRLKEHDIEIVDVELT